ncbi:aKG-HExxH-type peptide beta-hydroxylase [Pseudomonas sp. PGPR40]|uniref:aKG-HExxH-type peptide beta-hydroxylase n=1 Tax=Pseudomonas sp. PGPR40 TaxID=2913476 RepID=UPI001EDC90A6|nr:HEXXH motif-containing putative peptide modification protein [Pseudomonas sp. PGPR40]
MLNKQKSAIYATSKYGLLIFSHADHPEVGYQVPSGTIKPNEAPVEAAVREFEEETGLIVPVEKFQYRGEYYHDMRPFRVEVQRRHVFEVLIESPSETWNHWEMHPDIPGSTPTSFCFQWAPMSKRLPDLLAVGQGRPLINKKYSQGDNALKRLEYVQLNEDIAFHRLVRYQRNLKALEVLFQVGLDKLYSSNKPSIMSLVSHATYMASYLIKNNQDVNPAFILLSKVMEFAESCKDVVILDANKCFFPKKHGYETPPYLATATALQAEQAMFQVSFSKANELLQEWGFAETTSNSVGVIITLREIGMLDASNSYTLSGVPGTMYSDVMKSPLRLAETLLHEATHNWLNDALAVFQPEGFQDEDFWSPWRHKQRPVYGIIQACLVFSKLTQLFAKAIRSNDVSSVDQAYAVSRLRIEQKVLRDQVEVLTTAISRLNLKELRAVCEEELNRALNIDSAL